MASLATTSHGLGFFKTASSEGAYWQSTELATKLHAFLREFTPEAGFKQANIGGDQESGFEQAFSSLAFAYLKDRAPRLLDYIIGFQLVDRNEDNTKAIGIFGFKVGKTWLYAPVFFLNGDLKGNELLYIKNQDAFVPAKENWVNYILARRPHTLGEGSDQDVFQLGGLSPNFSRLAGNVGGRGKFSSDVNGKYYAPTEEAARALLVSLDGQGHGIIKDAAGNRISGCRCDGSNHTIVTVDPTKCAVDATNTGRIGGRDVDGWARDFYPLFAAAATKQANFLFRDQPKGQRLDLAKIASAPLTAAFVGDAAVPDLTDFLSSHPSLLKHAHQLYKTYPGVKVAFDRFYGGEDYFLTTAKAMAAKYAGDVMNTVTACNPPRYLTRSDLLSGNYPKVYPSPASAVKSAAVLDDAEKTRLMTEGYVIQDKRADDKKTTAYDVTTKNIFTNATETGLCDVLVKPGSVEKMIVLVNPYSEKGPTSLTCAFKVSGEKPFTLSLPTQLYVTGTTLRSDWTDWYDKQSDKTTPGESDYYVFVGANGQATLPFNVGDKYNENRYRVNFCDSIGSMTQDEAKRRLPHNVRHGPTTGTKYGVLMTVGERGGSRIQTVDGIIHIPKDGFKLVKVKNVYRDDQARIGLASPLDLQALLTEKTARLKIWSDGVEVSMLSKLGSVTLSPREALFNLVQKHGLDENAAKALLKQAASGRDAVAVGLKYAAGYPFMGGGPNAPAMPPPEVGSEQVGYGSVPAQYQQEEHLDIPGSDASTTDPSVYDPFLTPDRGAMGIAEEAGQSGQKEVFDASMISGMLKSVTQDSMIDRYLGPLMKALDKLGRLMFMLYWHQEEFQDRFGKAELPDLEDAIRNTFEALGDTLLTLKEKTIDAGLDEIGDPDISNVARN